MGKAERQKGQRGERLVRDKFRAIFPDAARDLNDVNDEEGVDLKETGNFAVQVKHYKNHVPLSKFREIQPTDGRIRCLVSWPTNRKDEPLIILTLDDFIRLIDMPELSGVKYDTR